MGEQRGSNSIGCWAEPIGERAAVQGHLFVRANYLLARLFVAKIKIYDLNEGKKDVESLN